MYKPTICVVALVLVCVVLQACSTEVSDQVMSPQDLSLPVEGDGPSLALEEWGPESDPDPSLEPSGDRSPVFIEIGPIDGITTVWHRAPEASVLPAGTVLDLRVVLPEGAVARWDGDTVGEEAPVNGGAASKMRCVLPDVGRTTVAVNVTLGTGQHRVLRCSFESRNMELDSGASQAMQVSAVPLDVHDHLTNEETMGLFFGEESVGRLVKDESGRYVSSVGRTLVFSPPSCPPGMESLMEWRIDGVAVGLGTDGFGRLELSRRFEEPGEYLVEVGPLASGAQARLSTFKSKIVSHDTDLSIVAEGKPVRFVAETDPPGYEHLITWLSSTKYGSAQPVTGTGPFFDAVFSNTWGRNDDGTAFQWLGVAADDDRFNQDQKTSGDVEVVVGRVEEVLDGLVEDFPDQTPCFDENADQALADLVAARDAARDALDEISALGWGARAAINLVAKSKLERLEAELPALEAAAADLRALPPCGDETLLAQSTICDVLQTLAVVLGIVGPIIRIVGLVITPLNPAIGLPLVAAGTKVIAAGIAIGTVVVLFC